MATTFLGGAWSAATATVTDAKLVFTRADGIAIRFAGSPHIWCGPYQEDVSVPAIHVRLATPGRTAGWRVDAVRRDVVHGQRVSFPLDFVWDSPRGASVFVAAHGNETSSGQEESSGSIRFSRVSCRPGGVVAFTIDATLDSEIGEPPITVVGRFRGHVSRRP